MAINIFIYLLFTVSGLIFMKLGAGNTNIQYSKSILNISLNIYIIIGLIAYMISFVMYIILLKKYNLSYIVPITTSLSYIAVLISGVLIFKERITPMNGVAVVLILIGVIILNVSK
jgi:multidrug transporter EmrE-like cation transporter